MQFSKLSAPSLKELFIDQLQSKILSGELAMGTRLPPERELAMQMQVSRAVVNSGLAELADRGFVEVRPRLGVYVTDYRKQGNLNTLIAIMDYHGGILGNNEIRSILEVRRALEHLITASAIVNASDETLEKLGETLPRLALAGTNADAADAAFAFQHQLALCSGNSIVPLIYYSFRSSVISLWIRFCRLYGIQALVKNTETLYGLIRARDEQAASLWIDTYLGEAIRGSQQIYTGD